MCSHECTSYALFNANANASSNSLLIVRYCHRLGLLAGFVGRGLLGFMTTVLSVVSSWLAWSFKSTQPIGNHSESDDCPNVSDLYTDLIQTQ